MNQVGDVTSEQKWFISVCCCLWADVLLMSVAVLSVSVAVFGLMFYQCLSLSLGWCFISVSLSVGCCFISVCRCLWADVFSVSVTVFGMMFYQCLSLSLGWCFISVCHCLCCRRRGWDARSWQKLWERNQPLWIRSTPSSSLSRTPFPQTVLHDSDMDCFSDSDMDSLSVTVAWTFHVQDTSWQWPGFLCLALSVTVWQSVRDLQWQSPCHC